MQSQTWPQRKECAARGRRSLTTTLSKFSSAHTWQTSRVRKPERLGTGHLAGRNAVRDAVVSTARDDPACTWT